MQLKLRGLMSIVFSFFSAKGGVGKSVLSNLVANELIYQAIRKQAANGVKKELFVVPRVLLVDVDAQHSNYHKREMNTRCIKIPLGSTIYNELPSHEQSEIRLLRKSYAFLKEKYGYNPYEILAVDTADEEEVTEALGFICGGMYDYVIIDFPGTYDQKGIGVFLSTLDYMFMPTTNQSEDIHGAIDALVKWFSLIDRYKSQGKNPVPELKEIKLIHNKTDISRQKYCAYTEHAILSNFPDRGLSFFETRVKNLVSMSYNSILPISAKVDHRDNTIAESLQAESIVSLVKEILSLINKSK